MLEGVVRSVAPEGSRRVNYEALTQAGGGWIAVDPRTGEADQPYFEIVVRLVNPTADPLAYGTTGTVQFVAASQPLGTGCVRRVARFWNRLAGTRG